MRIWPLVISLSLALQYVARADQPAEPAPTAVTSAPAGSTAATATVPPADAAVEKTPAQLKREAAEAKIKQYGVNGYKPESTKSGDVVYCKKEAPIGSRFETKQCRTYQQLKDEAFNAKEYVEQMQRVGPQSKN